MTSPADPQRWRRISELFDRALDLDHKARAWLLERECEGDPALREQIERMLAADAATSAFDDGAADAVSLEAGDRSESHDDSREQIGQLLGPWRLEGVLGRGGMGTVYAARRDDRDTLQHAAIKRLHRRWDGSLHAQRFLQERRILAALSHPHIPRLLDHGLDEEQRPWLALEYVDGASLIDWADAHKQGLRARIELFREVCAAVQHAHEHFVVHRDLKPANILVDGEGHPKVLDFGVAKRIDDAGANTRTGAFAGFTPEYAAPEQIAGGVISAATDVYALGVILYQLLSGQLPYRFDQDNLHDAAQAITSRTAERLEKALTTGTPEQVQARIAHRETTLPAFRRFVRGDLTRIVQTALAKEPPRRYASVQAMSTDLKRFLEGRTVSVSGDTFGYRTRKFVQRNRGSMAMAMVAVIAASAGLIGILLQTREARSQAARAELQAARAENVKSFVLQLLADTNPGTAGFGGDPKKVLTHTSQQVIARFAGQPELLAQTSDVLAATMSSLGERRTSAQFLRSVLDALQHEPNAPAWSRALIETRLAEVDLQLGQAQETERLTDRVIATLPETSASHARVLSDAWQLRAFLRLRQGRETDALNAVRNGARIARRWLGAGSREAIHADAGVLGLLASTTAGASAAALTEGGKILAAIRRHYGDTHPVSAEAMRYMAKLEQAHGRYGNSEALYRRLLTLSGDTDAPILLHEDLGAMYEETDRFREAQTEYEQALTLLAAQDAPEAHALSTARNNLAFTLFRAGDWVRAARYFQLAGDDWQRIHADPDHLYVLSARTRQAEALLESGRLGEAQAVLSDLIPRVQAHDPDFYPIALGVRAKFELAQRKPREALASSDLALTAAAHGELTPRSLAALHLARARALEANGDAAEAVATAARAAQLLDKADPWRNPEMARVAAVRLGLSRLPQADAAQLCAALTPGAQGQPAASDAPFQRPLRAALQRCNGRRQASIKRA